MQALIGGAGPGAFAAIAGGFVGWWAFIAQRYELFLLKSGQNLIWRHICLLLCLSFGELIAFER